MINKAVYEDYLKSAEYIKNIIKEVPDIAIVLGSGLGFFADKLSDKVIIPYREIPGFPVSTVSYFKGELVYGSYMGKKLLCMNGRFHYYEGYEMWQTAYYVGVFKLLGINKLIVTNAAGGIADELSPGDLVMLVDHIKLTSESPLRGKNIPEFGERFFDMQSVYDKELRKLAHSSAEKLSIDLKEGVYGYMSGPQYETPAEIRMLKLVGASVVGMSTVPEIIAAAQCKIAVLAISCVSNMAAGITGNPLTESEVLETANSVKEKFSRLISEIITGV